MALPSPSQQPQQQPQPFSFDLDTSRANPYKWNFVFTFTKSEGWNEFPLQDPTLPVGSLLLVEHVEVTSAGACGQPYIVKHDDARVVGQRTTRIQNTDLSKPSWFPKWAGWSSLIHGVCALDCPERKEVLGEVEALNEGRFFFSELYMTLSELVQRLESDGNQYKVRMWKTQVEAHIQPRILRVIRHGSIMECLTKRYLECPLVKVRLDHPIMYLCLHLPAPTNDQDLQMCVAVTVSGKRISNICTPAQYSSTLGSIDKFAEALLRPVENGVDFEEYFRQFPIRFHRELIALK